MSRNLVAPGLSAKVSRSTQTDRSDRLQIFLAPVLVVIGFAVSSQWLPAVVISAVTVALAYFWPVLDAPAAKAMHWIVDHRVVGQRDD
jgi:hypothetical protein